MPPGPYDDGAKLWETSDVDPCNGAWSKDDSDFFFVVSRRPAAFSLVTAMVHGNLPSPSPMLMPLPMHSPQQR